MQVKFDLKIQDKEVFTNRLIAGLFLVVYNWLRVLNILDATAINDVFFIISCALMASLIFEGEVRSKRAFYIVVLGNTLLFSVAYILTRSFTEIETRERLLILSLILVIYFMLYAMINVVKSGALEDRIGSFDKIVTGFIFVIIAFTTLLIHDPKLSGVSTINIFFIGMVLRDYLDRYLFGKKLAKQQKIDGHKRVFLKQKYNLPEKLYQFKLTEVQLEIAELLLQNYTITQIADKRNVSENAIHQQCYKINKKTGSKSTLDFVHKFGLRQL